MPESVNVPLLETLHSGFIGQGAKVEEFEHVLSNYFDNPYALTLNSGTSGLQLALRLSDVGHGDEVISTPMTCTASNMPVLAAGGSLVWADINPVTGNIDPRDIERKITEKTKAIIVVHWGGYPCDMDEICAIAKAHNLRVIEDGAHSFGAQYKGKRIGNHADFVMFSLQAIKHITTIDGGVLMCQNEKDYERGRLLRWYGIDRNSKRKDFRCEEDIEEWGYKFHMNDICAVIGIEQMKYVDGIVEKNRANARFLDEELQGLRGVRTIPWAEDRQSANWLYTIHVDRRQDFMAFMKTRDVMVSQVHARNDTHSCFAPYVSDSVPNVSKFSETMCCIPNGWWLSESELQQVVAAVREFSTTQ
jgi:dTDP-4-amino-4,6-dideoxygalactose transaminase